MGMIVYKNASRRVGEEAHIIILTDVVDPTANCTNDGNNYFVSVVLPIQ